MRRRWFLAGLAAAAATAGVSADARMHAPYRGHRIVPASALPLDGFTAPAAAYSFRRLRTAYTGPAIRLRRASDNAEQDINFLGFVPGTGAPLDVAAANAFCAATTCFVRTLYDQSGNALHMVQTTLANQPLYVANCNGTSPCLSETAPQSMAVAGQTPNVVMTFSAVARHAAYPAPGGGAQACQYIGAGNQNWIQQHSDFDLVILTNSSVTINNGTATRLGWHALTGVYNGASSVNRVDASEVTGSFSAGTASGNLFTTGVAVGNTCQVAELVWWNGYALPPAERTAFQTNQKSFWATP